jgi:hypothetical protein
VLDAETGNKTSKVKYGGKYTTIVEGIAYCVDSQGMLYATELDKAPKIKVSR